MSRSLGLAGLGLTRGGGKPVLTFAQQMAALPGLLAWWPQTEASGAVADNAESTAARDAAYSGTYTRQGATFANGDKVVLYTSGRLRWGTSNLAAAWNWNNCWFSLWAQPNATQQADSSRHGWIRVYSFTTGWATLDFYKENTPYKLYLVYYPTGSVNSFSWIDWSSSANYTHFAIQIKQPYGYLWRNGVLVATVATLSAATDTALDVSNVDFNVLATGIGAANIALPHFAVGTGVLTTSIVDNLYRSIYPGVLDLFVTGDSHATNNDYWIQKLVGNIEVGSGGVWRENPYRIGYSGNKVDYWNTHLVTDLALVSGNPSKIAVNICANDITAGTSEATVKSNLGGGIDQLRAKWSNADIYVAQPYRDDNRNGSYDTYALGLKQWILDVIATYPAHVFAGPDENTWFKGANIDTYSSDRIHPTTDVGHIACAAAWQAAMGY